MIYRIAIPNFDNFSEYSTTAVREAVEGLADWIYDNPIPGSRIQQLVTRRPVNQTIMEKIAEALLQVRVQYSVEDLSSKYVHVATTAPAVFDYDYVIDLGYSAKSELHGKEERHIAMPATSFAYQTGRYASGLYASRKIE